MLKARNISHNTTEVTLAAMEVITIWSSEDESEEESEAPPGLGADEFSSIGNEGALEQIQYQLRDLVKIMEQLGNLRKYQAASSA